MSGGRESSDGTQPLPAAWRLDAICNRFEIAWKAARSDGTRPRIESYVNEAPEAERPALLRELILLDMDYRRWQGESPQPEDYRGQFPSLDLGGLASAAAVPGAGPVPSPAAEQPSSSEPAEKQATLAEAARRVRCPHCHNPIQLADRGSDEVHCPACGSTFCIRDAPFTDTLSPMRRLGKFQLLQRVGLGAFGAVWKSRDTELDRVVALKIPHGGLSDSPEGAERFHREARAAAQLRHPNVVTVHEVATLDSGPAIGV